MRLMGSSRCYAALAEMMDGGMIVLLKRYRELESGSSSDTGKGSLQFVHCLYLIPTVIRRPAEALSERTNSTC